MSTAKELHELQEVDLNIEQRTQALEQVKSQLGKDDDLAASRVALDTAKKHLLNWNISRKQVNGRYQRPGCEDRRRGEKALRRLDA